MLSVRRADTIRPNREHSVSRDDATSEMRRVVECRAGACHDDVCHQAVLAVDPGLAFDGTDHRNTDVGDVLDDLGALVVHFGPDVRITHVTEGAEVDVRHPLSALARQDDDLVGSIAADRVEGVDELFVIPGGEFQRATVGVELHEEHALGIARHVDAFVLAEVLGIRGVTGANQAQAHDGRGAKFQCESLCSGDGRLVHFVSC